MKMNIKGLVFVGFAAAVFASAANAADKTVTSKTYVDAKYVGDDTTITVTDGTGANAGKKVIALNSTLDTDAYEGTAPINVDDHTISVSAMGAATASAAGSAGVVPAPAAGDNMKFLRGDATWQEIEGSDTTYTFDEGTTNGTISVTEEGGSAQSIAVHGLDNAAYKDVDTAITDQNATSTNLPTTEAVYNFATSADRQSNWAQSDSAKPDYIKNKPGNFGGATAAGAGSAGFVPAPAAGDQGKVLGGNGQWVEVDGTPYEQGTGITIDDHTIINAGVRQVTATPSTGTDGTITVNTNGSSVEVAVKGLQAAAYLGKDESIDSSSTHNDAATAKAVYDFVTTPTNILPTNANCTTDAPCALVMAGSSITWEPIQQ